MIHMSYGNMLKKIQRQNQRLIVQIMFSMRRLTRIFLKKNPTVLQLVLQYAYFKKVYSNTIAYARKKVITIRDIVYR